MRNKIWTDFQFLTMPVQIVIGNLDMNVQFNKHIGDGSWLCYQPSQNRIQPWLSSSKL